MKDIDEARRSLALYFSECERAAVAPTASGFADMIGLRRPTLYARFPDLAREIAARKLDAGANSTGRPRDDTIRDLRNQLQVARRERADAHEELQLYAEQVRRLSIENAELLRELESAAGAVPINQRILRRVPRRDPSDEA